MARTLRIADIDPIAVAGVSWHPLRRTLGVSAFGTNAYSADAGERVIEEHMERDHEELYVVLSGRATFTTGDEEHDAPAGTVVWLPDPAELRGAVAAEDGTLVLAVGGRPGAAGPPSAWEHRFAAAGVSSPAEAYEITAAALTDHPDDGATHYDLACHAAQAGRADQAIEHLTRAVELDPRARRWAETDADLDAIRADQRFPR